MKPLDYWKEDEPREDQYFYVAFALVASAVNDFGVANDLHLSGKLNWAASAYYYSVVHAGRLALFLVYGDFPTRHRELAQAFREEGVSGGPFWFSSLQGTMTSHVQRSDRHEFNRRELVSRYEGRGMDAAHVESMFGRWARLFDKAKGLREDANYESLLIAHEHHHVVVTRAFEKLCETLQVCSTRILRDAVGLLKAVLDSSPRRQHWLAFLNDAQERHGLLYIEDSLENVISPGPSLNAALSILKPLRSPGGASPLFSMEVYRNIEMGAFSGKANKMREFEGRIDDLTRAVQ